MRKYASECVVTMLAPPRAAILAVMPEPHSAS